MNRSLLAALAAATLATLAPAAQASTAAYDAMVAAGLTQEGAFDRIVINNTIGLAGSATFAADPLFNAVIGVATSSGGEWCTGTLIAPATVLTARHCSVNSSYTIHFGTDFSNPIYTASILSVSNPGGAAGGSLSGNDVTIVRLTQPVPSSIATPMLLTDATTQLLGSTVAMVGFGNRGIGSSGVTGWDGIRRGGTNVLDYFGAAPNTSGFQSGSANILSTDFDNPSGTSNTLGWQGSSPAALEYEATTANGDSGGPIMVWGGDQWLLAGTLTGGTTNNSVYGDISWWTSIAAFRTQIEAAGGVFVPVPEPGTWAMMALGLACIGWMGRRRAA